MDVSTAHLLEILIAYRYLVLLPLAIMEGPFLAFIAGGLVALGYFNPFLALGILVLGDIIPDTFFYTLGHYGKNSTRLRRFRERIGVTQEHLERGAELWRTHPAKTMLMTKFAYGIASAFLFMAGMLGVPPRIFYSYSIAISITHYGIVMALGYYLGSALFSVQNVFTAIELGVGLIALAGIVYYFVISYIRRQVA